MSTAFSRRRRISNRNRNPAEIQELDRQIKELQDYLYNFWIKNVKALAVHEGLPVEFFIKKYELEIEIQVRKFIEQIYISRIKSMEKKLLKIEKKQQRSRSKSASIHDVFTSITDIENIKRIASTVVTKFFNSIGRLIGRENTSTFNPLTQTAEKPLPFSDMTAMRRVAERAGYSAYNEATQSKLMQIDTTERVQYITARDERVCEICMPLDGMIYEVLSADIPELPQHDFCRCFLELVE